MHLDTDVSIPPLVDVTSATSVDSVSKSSENSTNIVPFIAGSIIGVFVLLGSVVILVVIAK